VYAKNNNEKANNLFVRSFPYLSPSTRAAGQEEGGQVVAPPNIAGPAQLAH
jgi:hypothetical protein